MSPMGVGGELRLRRVDRMCSTSVMRPPRTARRMPTKVGVSFCRMLVKMPS